MINQDFKTTMPASKSLAFLCARNTLTVADVRTLIDIVDERCNDDHQASTLIPFTEQYLTLMGLSRDYQIPTVKADARAFQANHTRVMGQLDRSALATYRVQADCEDNTKANAQFTDLITRLQFLKSQVGSYGGSTEQFDEIIRTVYANGPRPLPSL